MERTKGLTMSEEERRRALIEETSAKVRGLLQRYLDAALSREAFEEQFIGLQRLRPGLAADALRKACLDRVDLDKDNAPLLYLLERFELCSTDGLRKLMKNSAQELEGNRERHRRELLKTLAGKGIKGSALVPNLAGDAVWNRLEAQARDAFREGLRSLY